MKKFFGAFGRALCYFIGYFAIQLVVSILFAVVIAISAMSGVGANDFDAFMTQYTNAVLEQTMLISFVSNAVTVIALVIFFKIRKKRLTQETALYSVPYVHVLGAVMFGIGFAFLSPLITEFIPFSEAANSSFESMYGMIFEGPWIFTVLGTVVGAPIVEELVFRGLVYTRLKSGMSPIAAAVISALMFGIMHGELIWVISAFIAGLALVWVYEKTGSLACAIAVHMVNNALSIIDVGVLENYTALSIVIHVICAVFLVGGILMLHIDPYEKEA